MNVEGKEERTGLPYLLHLSLLSPAESSEIHCSRFPSSQPVDPRQSPRLFITHHRETRNVPNKDRGPTTKGAQTRACSVRDYEFNHRESTLNRRYWVKGQSIFAVSISSFKKNSRGRGTWIGEQFARGAQSVYGYSISARGGFGLVYCPLSIFKYPLSLGDIGPLCFFSEHPRAPGF